METITELRDHPIFICGHPKSGTSLVKAILDFHPQLVVYPEETVFFRRFLPKAKGLNLQEQLDLADRYLIHIFTWNKDKPHPSQIGFPDRDYSAFSYQAIHSQMRDLVQSKYRHEGDILSAAILAFGQVSRQISGSTRYWVEKSPYNEYFADRIFDWWPEARCVHILRDPRDNYASYHVKHPSWNAEFFSTNWNRSTNTGIQNLERYGNSRYLILRYEDLVQSPKESLIQLTEFLGIQWSDSLSTPTRAGKQWKGNSMFTDRFQGISTAPVSRWKEILPILDAATIELMSRDCVDSFHYPRQSLDEIEFTELLALRWRTDTWPIRRLLSRFRRSASKIMSEEHDQEEITEDDSLSD